MIFSQKNLPLTALLGHPVQKYFFLKLFALIKKIFLQTLVEIIFRYQKYFLDFREAKRRKVKISFIED